MFVATTVVAADEAPPKFVGSSSCATALCHGGLSGRKVVGAEFPLWAARDPHSRAYSVLLNDRSKQMAARLTLSNKTAHESAECLNCHSPATALNAPTITDRAPPAGVDCERCHGAAELWLTPHKRKDWKARSAEEKSRLGFTNLADVLTRAKLCTECHVGGPERDVNHTLIAAGHPRLFFEFSTFHANWPKHWPRKTDENNHPVSVAKPNAPASPGSLFEAKLWAVGQVITAQSSLKLLSHRAAKVQAWPEFAEWNCYACHHDLAPPNLWKSPAPEKRLRNSFGWNSWPYAMLEPLARQTHGPDLNGPTSPISGILQLRPRFTKPLPPAEIIAADAAAAAKSLQAWAEQFNQAETAQKHLAPSSLESLRQSLVSKDAQQLVARDWDSATQVFVSIIAVRYAEKAARGVPAAADEPSDKQIKALLDTMQKTLDFQDGHRSPRQSELRHLDTLLNTPP
ncbi:MAG: hypothetical protein IAG10_32505 [Planctomycetaceae bacterium]|nr:hypothetical protein [Planctomycetaceae bacterium]